jgi:succinoglycan biosynthesis transport protein ExoP
MQNPPQRPEFPSSRLPRVANDPAGDPFHGFFGQQQRPSRHQAAEEALDIGKYLTALRRRWLLILACCLLAALYAVVRYSLTEKMFKATATIQIERKRLSVLALGQAGWLEDWWNMEYYPTQYRLLRSRGMAERVVLNLRLQEDPSFNPKAAQVLQGGGRLADSSNELAQLASRVQGGLTVTPITDTQLVELSYQSTSPELAARIANGYADVFIEWGIENRTYTVGQASSFLSAQIETLRQEIEERQKQLNSYASKSGFTVDPAGEALVERRQTLESQYNAVVAQRIGKEAAYRQAGGLAPDSVASSLNGAQLKADVIKLESEYRTKLDTYTPEWPEMVALKAQIDDKREQIKRLTDEGLRESVGRAYAEYQKAKREEETLEAELRKLAGDARLQNSSAFEYANQTTYIDTRKQLLTELVKRQSETEVASRVQTSQESNVRVVDRAIVPGRAFRPVLQSDLMSAILLGLLFGVGTIVVLEYFDRTIKDPEELEAALGFPALGVIPDIDEKAANPRYGRGYNYSYGYGYAYRREDPAKEALKDAKEASKEKQIELLPHHSPRLAVSEAYRSLRTALLLSTARELQVVTLTSAMPSEGKTATTTNLGVVMAQLGRRVLLIDADLRRPRMHKVFKVSNRHGLVTFLTAHVDVDGLFVETGVPNLWLCPSGPIPPNPSELLASERMAEFLQEVRKRFDFVLIDTPPILPVADAVVVGTQTDGVIVCARAGVLNKDDAKFCNERLSYAELKVIGALLNRYRATPGRYKKNYRYYGVYEETKETKAFPAA